MTKQLIIPEIKCCDECPYLHYDAFYSMSTDSGYDCKKVQRRVIDDGDMVVLKNGINVCRNEPIEIPNWCPLPDKKGFQFR